MILTRCPCCRGSGQVALTGVYLDTLTLLAKQGKEMTGAELSRLAGCKETTMNQRLDQLERKGLLVSRTYGRKRLFRVADREDGNQ